MVGLGFVQAQFVLIVEKASCRIRSHLPVTPGLGLPPPFISDLSPGKTRHGHRLFLQACSNRSRAFSLRTSISGTRLSGTEAAAGRPMAPHHLFGLF